MRLHRTGPDIPGSLESTGAALVSRKRGGSASRDSYEGNVDNKLPGRA
jgi:hypothetical protein